MEKLRQSDLETKLRQQLYSKLQTYLKLLKDYEDTHGQMGRIVLERDIKKLEAEGKSRSEAIADLAKANSLESPPQMESIDQSSPPQKAESTRPSVKTQPTTPSVKAQSTAPSVPTVAVVEMGPDEESLEPQKNVENVDDEVKLVSPLKEETLTPPRKAEDVEKSRQVLSSVARPRPTELLLLAALSAVNGVMSFAAAWVYSQYPGSGLPFLELFMTPAALIPTESYLPLLELISLVFCAVFVLSMAFMVVGKKWAWNLTFGSTAAWMVIIALSAAFVSSSFVNLALLMLILSAVSFYVMTSNPVKDFFRT